MLMAKSEIHTTYVWWTVENWAFHHTGGRENDFAISIKNDDDPGCWDEDWTGQGRKKKFGCAILQARSCREHVSAGKECGCGW
jgi:hypothetical protein